jgi:hypothetical protein
MMQQIDKNLKTCNMENFEIISLTNEELNNINGGSELSDNVWFFIGTVVGAMRYGTKDQFMLTALGH